MEKLNETLPLELPSDISEENISEENVSLKEDLYISQKEDLSIDTHEQNEVCVSFLVSVTALDIFSKDSLVLESRGKWMVLEHRSLHLGSLHPEGHVWASTEAERVL